MLFWYFLALLIIIVWTLIMMGIFYSKWKEPLEKRGFALQGPFVLWKTVKGKQFIERIAKKEKAVELYGKIGVWITGLAMVIMTFFLFWSAFLVLKMAKHIVLEPHMLLGLPGLNPLIPLWYGIFALVIAMVVHEFSHGILSALAKVKILSLGVLFFIFPMGAFVEPDEKELKKIEKKKRVRMYSAGPASNMIVAGVCSLIFSMVLMGGVQPAHEGVGILSVSEDIEIESQNFTMKTPAYNASLSEGMIIFSLNGNKISGYDDFARALSNTRPRQNVSLSYYFDSQVYHTNVTLTFKGYYYWEKYGDNYTGALLKDLDLEYNQVNINKVNRKYINKGYLGIGTTTVSTAHFHPLGGADELGGVTKSFSTYIILPLMRLSPVQGSTMDFYEITGFWSFLPDNVFWIISNAFYWVFWLNLMVGLTNALPAVPLDGGYIFKDWLETFVGKRKIRKAKTEAGKFKRRLNRAVRAEAITRSEADERYSLRLGNIMKQNRLARDNIVNKIVITLAFTILFLILWQVIGPRVI